MEVPNRSRDFCTYRFIGAQDTPRRYSDVTAQVLPVPRGKSTGHSGKRAWHESSSKLSGVTAANALCPSAGRPRQALMAVRNNVLLSYVLQFFSRAMARQPAGPH